MIGRMPDLAIGTFSSVTRAPARAELRSELCVYALAMAPASVSARAGAATMAAESTSAAATLLRNIDTSPLFRLSDPDDHKFLTECHPRSLDQPGRPGTRHWPAEKSNLNKRAQHGHAGRR